MERKGFPAEEREEETDNSDVQAPGRWCPKRLEKRLIRRRGASLPVAKSKSLSPKSTSDSVPTATLPAGSVVVEEQHLQALVMGHKKQAKLIQKLTGKDPGPVAPCTDEDLVLPQAEEGYVQCPACERFF